MVDDWSSIEPKDSSYDYSTEELKTSLLSFYETKENADLKIVCGVATFSVHSVLLWIRSKFFNAAYHGHFKEGRTKEIELCDDDPYMVYRMILYIYTIEYPDTQIAPPSPKSNSEDAWRYQTITNRQRAGPKPKKCDTPIETITEDTWTTAFNTNVRMYALAEKYDIKGLKKLAEKKLDTLIQEALKSQQTTLEDALLAEISLIYESTPASDRGLRNCVLSYVKNNWVRLSQSEQLKDVISKAPEFAIELVTTMSQKDMYKGRCMRCWTHDRWTAERVRCLCGWAETVC